MGRLRFKKQALKRNVKELEMLAFKIFRNGHLPSPSLFVRDKRIRGWCGCSSETMAKAWMLLMRGGLKRGASMERFLWAMMLLKSYDTEIVGAGRVGGVDEETFSTWAWYFIDELSYLEGDLVSVAATVFSSHLAAYCTALSHLAHSGLSFMCDVDQVGASKDERHWK